MYKKMAVFFLTALMLLTAGCRNDVKMEEAAEQPLTTEPNPPASVSVQDESDVPDGTVSGVSNLDDSLTNPFDITTDTNENNAVGSSNISNEASGEKAPTDTVTRDPNPTDSPTSEPETERNYVTYQEYNNMTPEEQTAYFSQFPSMREFIKWHNEAKAKYDKEHGVIDVGDGKIDINDIIKP